MKVIFLDIDGVLDTIQGDCYHLANNKHTANRWNDRPDFNDGRHTYDQFKSTDWCPVAIAHLCWLLRASPTAMIVVSSTWRTSYSNDEMRWLFVYYPEIFNRVIGRTKRLFDESGQTHRRGIEIQEWLDRHPETQSFVIIDDDADMEHLMLHLVKTSGTAGLSYKNVNEALQVLGEPDNAFVKVFNAAQKDARE